MKFTENARSEIISRAAGKCEKCDGIVRSGGQIHHRKARGMGGTKSLESRSLANGLYVHPSCHAWIESHRAEAYENGWLVHSWQASVEVPVMRGHQKVLLTEDGRVVPSE
jgi:5-methylcytosine-specific restriction protein A